MLAKCNGDYVVKYYDSWVENKILFIEMELCSDNLKNIILIKAQCFERRDSESMNSLEYFISCQIFKELLECVGYLHESDPPIIHRDLKPHNILVNYRPRNNRFLKLCDFGLAKEQENSKLSNTNGLGTFRYAAPEVYGYGLTDKSNYTTLCDVYSLGKIATDLFDLDIYSYEF